MRETTVGVKPEKEAGRTGKNARGERVVRVGSPRRLRCGQRGQTPGDHLVAVMIVLVIATAVAYIGIDVLEELQTNITDRNLGDTADSDQDNFENATEAVSGGFADAMGLVDIVMIVLLFSVILGALLAFRR